MSDDELSVSWSRPPLPGDDLLILLHGFEGTEHDLDDRFPDLPRSVVTASLRAPVEQNAGHAWFLDDYGVRDAVDGVLEWLDTQSDVTVADYVGMGHWISAAEATDVCAFVAVAVADGG